MTPLVGVASERQKALMVKKIDASRLSVRAEAEKFLASYGFSTPPLPPDQALSARNLEVVQLTLDDLLVNVNLPSEDHNKIQAMLDTRSRSVVFKDGLPDQKKNWGSVHEVAHDFIPWQRDLLYYCPLLLLSPEVQKQFETEADIFAAEAFFFGGRFHRQAYSDEFGLNTAITLATDVYQTSLHVTFVHYVEESPLPRCLIIWKRKSGYGLQQTAEQLVIHYYVKSKSFRGHIAPRQIADPDGVVVEVFNDPGLGVVEHEMIVVGRNGREYISAAESFSNSYNVFTLLSPPVRSSVHPMSPWSE